MQTIMLAIMSWLTRGLVERMTPSTPASEPPPSPSNSLPDWPLPTSELASAENMGGMDEDEDMPTLIFSVNLNGKQVILKSDNLYQDFVRYALQHYADGGIIEPGDYVNGLYTFDVYREIGMTGGEEA